MTEPHHETDPLEGAALERAAAALGELREVLLASGRGASSPSQVRVAIAGYFQQHGPSLRTAAAAVGEETRRQNTC